MRKPNKSIQKRVRITKTGKLIRRKSHLNHFNAKESRRAQRRHSERVVMSGTYKKIFRQYMS